MSDLLYSVSIHIGGVNNGILTVLFYWRSQSLCTWHHWTCMIGGDAAPNQSQRPTAYKSSFLLLNYLGHECYVAWPLNLLNGCLPDSRRWRSFHISKW